MRIDHLPLFVGGVACIAQPIALILRTRDFSPGQDVIPRGLRKHEKIAAAEITQPPGGNQAIVPETFQVSLLANMPNEGRSVPSP